MLERSLKPEDILVVATHRPGQALSLATSVIVMQVSGIVADNEPEKLFPDRGSNYNNPGDDGLSDVA